MISNKMLPAFLLWATLSLTTTTITNVDAFATKLTRVSPQSLNSQGSFKRSSTRTTTTDTMALYAATDANNGDNSSPSLTLYGHPGTRSPLCNWGAYEVGLDITMGDLSRNPHPFRQIPCLTDGKNGEILVFESGAILSYFNDLTKASLLSKSESAAVQSWIVWANASLDPICFLETPEGKVYDTGLKKPNKRIDVVNDILGKQKYLVSNETFTLADVAVASYFLYVLQFFPGTDLSSRWPNIVRYLKDCASRPTYAKAFGENVQAFLMDQLDQQPKKKVFGMF